MRFSKISVLTCGFGVAAASNAQLVIDSFDQGAFTNALSSAGTFVKAQQGTVGTPINVLGGQRDVLLVLNSNPTTVPNAISASIVTGAGLSVVSTASEASGQFGLNYNGDDVQSNASAFSNPGPMLVDLSNYDRFRVFYRFADQNVAASITVGANGNVYTANFTLPQQMVTSVNSVDILYSSLGLSAANAVNTQYVSFNFDTAVAADFTLTEIQAVPEPATMAALGIGALALVRRRRSR